MFFNPYVAILLSLAVGDLCQLVISESPKFDEKFLDSNPNSTKRLYFLNLPYFPKNAPFQAVSHMPYQQNVQHAPIPMHLPFQDQKTDGRIQWYQFMKKGKKKKQKKKKKFLKKLNKYYKKCGIPFNLKVIRRADSKNAPTELINIRNPPSRFYIKRRQSVNNINNFRGTYPRKNIKLQVRPFIPIGKRWKSSNPWKFAPEGREPSEYVLREPMPGSIGGSPPADLIFKYNRDKRIPVSQALVGKPDNEVNATGRPRQQSKDYNNRPLRLNVGEYLQNTVDNQTSIVHKKEFNENEKKFNTKSTITTNKPKMVKVKKPMAESITVTTPKIEESYQYKPAILISTLKPSQPNNLLKTTDIVTETTPWIPIVPPSEYYRKVQPKFESTTRNSADTTQKEKKYLSGGFQNLSSPTKEFGTRLKPKVNTNTNMLTKCIISTKSDDSEATLRNCKYSASNRDELNSDTTSSKEHNKNMRSLLSENDYGRYYYEKYIKRMRNSRNIPYRRMWNGRSDIVDFVTSQYPEDQIMSLNRKKHENIRNPDNSGFLRVLSSSILVRER